MSGASRWLAWALVRLAVVLHLFAHLFVILGIGVGTPGDADAGFGAVGYLIAFYAFPLVGVVIATRRPDHAIGWLFLAAGVAFGLSDLRASYADYALFANPGVLPAGDWAAWSVAWLDPLFFAFVILLVLLFPEGRLPSRRWRPVLALLVAAAVTTMVCSAIKPGVVFDTSLPSRTRRGSPVWSRSGTASSTVASFVFLSTALVAFVGTFAPLPARRGRGAAAVQMVRVRRLLPARRVPPARGRVRGLPRPAHRGAERHRVRRSRRRRRDRDPALPPLRHRPRHLEDARLRRAHRDPRRGVRRARARGAGRVLVVRGRRRTSRSPSRRSSSRRCSCRCARACSGSSTAASTAAATTRSARSMRSARGCASRSTSTTLRADLEASSDETMQPAHVVALAPEPGRP